MPSDAVQYHMRNQVGFLLIDYPPVNVLGASVRAGLARSLETALADESVRVIVIACAGKTFSAGADIGEFDGAMAEPTLQSVFASIEASNKPIVAALHGMALGGGVELALACHYRVATADAKLGLPEITLGLIPGAGGTQRLPRVIGAAAALDMIVSGAPVDAAAALKLGLVDAVVDADLLLGAQRFCEQLIEQGAEPRPTGRRAVEARGFDAAGIALTLSKHSRALKGRTTQQLVVEALTAATQSDFYAGLAIERRIADRSIATTESRALRHLFFAERQVAKVPGVAMDSSKAPIARVAVIGAGTMGSGIATACADAGIAVTLIDSHAEGIERGLASIASNYESSVERGRLTHEEAARRRGRIVDSLDLGAAAEADVVIEAVFEDLALKQSILSKVASLTAASTLLASNTSTLSIAELSRACRDPQRVVGLHFFSPAHVMKLLEIVRAPTVDPAALGRALMLAKQLKKIGVVAGDAFGFIGNKMMLDGYWREAELLMLEGATPEQVDSAMETFGFAMGPARVNDLGGTDVGTKTRIELFKRETRPDPYFVIADALTAMNRLGQKTLAGFYRYRPGERQALPDDEVIGLIAKLAAGRGIAQRSLEASEIVERCLVQLINVGSQVLEARIAMRAADIDVVWVHGYGFPRHLGGPMFHADSLGLKHVLERIEYYGARMKNRNDYWRPAPLLQTLAQQDRSFADWDSERAA
ncbi:3-hydroxyacyl-CoA dehydrogenase NAD-binding domain-containing protein [Peristeroidobacter agariperforans]|uniref:3-hydroxyacyl-CoA dehydrogenase NAD-binding domain-containing protein n=1 Tax=Peristeroidobacter agariperforans TaxID=268404 RepID=UPI00101C8EE2|nr:3-hydroxyacyl-CoA dehydrogenase NAD-binding domain-containing protein [Peristeroidobacter agariperforans]